MKKILCLITSLTLVTSTITPIAILASQKTINPNAKNQDIEENWANSFENLVKMINIKYTN